jgi:uncharacterized membrane protein
MLGSSSHRTIVVMMYWGGHMNTGDWVGSILMTLVIVALIVWIVWLAARGLSGDQRQSPSGIDRLEPSAGEILARRLAHGEITTEQYRELRAALGGATAAPAQPSKTASGTR